MEEFIEVYLDNTFQTASLSRMYHSVFKLLPAGINNFNVWFGGGCYVRTLLNEKIADIDFFSSDRTELAQLVKLLRKSGYKLYFSNKNAIKGYIENKFGRINIDIVKLIFPNEIETIRHFDFSVAKIVTNPKTNKCFYYSSVFVDIMQKRLILPHKLPAPLGTLKRMQKYIKRGFSACDGTMLTLSKQLAEINFNDPVQNIIEFYPDGRQAIPLWD